MKRYIDDLLRSNPKLFVDTVGPSGFIWYRNRESLGHEVFPEINKIVQDNYKLVDEVDGVRIYVRK